MSRTNIDIDDELIARVMDRHGFRTKKDAVNGALRRIDMGTTTREELLALEGTGWSGDLEEMSGKPEWMERDEKADQ